MLIDSHCHLDSLDLKNYNDDLSAALKMAVEQDVRYILSVSTNWESCRRNLDIAQTNQNIGITIGVHPGENLSAKVTVGELVNLGANQLVLGIGETGLEYHYVTDENKKARQRELFINHIHAAQQLKKPLIIHSREAIADVLAILIAEKAASGVLHCFTESWEDARKILDLGFYLGISGIVTFKNADLLREVVKKAPLDRLLLETDAPYLAPVPYRGKSNEPKYLPHIAHAIAAIKEITYEEVARQTTENFRALFIKY